LKNSITAIFPIKDEEETISPLSRHTENWGSISPVPTPMLSGAFSVTQDENTVAYRVTTKIAIYFTKSFDFIGISIGLMESFIL
jgi:hypothetical protein